jgi:tetratricopeptide (TPR) repeat protein
LPQIFLLQHKYKQAEQYYRKWLEIDPSNHFAYHGVGAVYQIQGKFNKAVAEFKKALELAPDQRWHYIVLAGVNVEQGNYDDALATYKMAMSLFPNCLYTTIAYSFLLNHLGKIQEARSIVESLLNNPNLELIFVDAGGMKQIAKFYLGKISKEQVEMDVENAMRKKGLSSSVTDAYYYLGMSYLLNLQSTHRDTTKAIESFNKYVSKLVFISLNYSLARAELRKLEIDL